MDMFRKIPILCLEEVPNVMRMSLEGLVKDIRRTEEKIRCLFPNPLDLIPLNPKNLFIHWTNISYFPTIALTTGCNSKQYSHGACTRSSWLVAEDRH